MLLFFLIFFEGAAKADQEIVVIQSIRISPYEEVIKGFKSICPGKIKRFVLAELEKGEILQKVNKTRPRLILAIGMDALSKVKSIKE